MRTHFSSSPDLFQPPKYPRLHPSPTESPGASWVPHRRFEAWELDSLQQGMGAHYRLDRQGEGG